MRRVADRQRRSWRQSTRLPVICAVNSPWRPRKPITSMPPAIMLSTNGRPKAEIYRLMVRRGQALRTLGMLQAPRDTARRGNPKFRIGQLLPAISATSPVDRRDVPKCGRRRPSTARRVPPTAWSCMTRSERYMTRANRPSTKMLRPKQEAHQVADGAPFAERDQRTEVAVIVGTQLLPRSRRSIWRTMCAAS